jgi:hypothetical protein
VYYNQSIARKQVGGCGTKVHLLAEQHPVSATTSVLEEIIYLAGV